MRALRTLLIVAVILGALFVLADRLAVNFAEDEVADRLRSSEGLTTTPDVSIDGFPFLTQVADGQLDDVKVGIKDYEAATGTSNQKIRIDNLSARMHDVRFTGDYSSATAATATGSATITYAELLKAAKSAEPGPAQVVPGVTATVVSLSDGGNGKIKVGIEATVLGRKLPQPVSVLSTVTVDGDTVKVKADSLPNLGIRFADGRMRAVTDFQQRIEGLPGGIKLDSVQAVQTGVDITVQGSNVSLAG
ncbi:DUF2993 domain-containing protein [Streptomyces graminilatus]|uniref:LmeA family phospholipid-binding protein n=1 Tax=Streptomyces graminilatus TaxID=1464070 RepID=UPI0006E2D2C3|nr:DUF2993 domain-containing protein [Streptomyces graminilatus]